MDAGKGKFGVEKHAIDFALFLNKGDA